MQTASMRFSSLFVVAVGLVVLTGCEDQQARNKGGKNEKEIEVLKEQYASIQKELKETQENFENLKQRLTARINERMQKIEDEVAKIHTEMGTQITQANAKTSQVLLDNVKNFREETEKRFQSIVTVDMAQQMQTIGEEIQQTRGELIGFMDKQLKELYPYAYQPRRVDPAEPPKTPQE